MLQLKTMGDSSQTTDHDATTPSKVDPTFTKQTTENEHATSTTTMVSGTTPATATRTIPPHPTCISCYYDDENREGIIFCGEWELQSVC